MAYKILLKNRGTRVERKAGGTITPGHLVMENSSGELVVHATAKGKTAALFAVENDMEGKTITDNYVSGDYVQAELLEAGAEVYALVPAAAAAIVIGDKLESNGDGTLRKKTEFAQSGTTPFAVTTEGHAIAEALEAVDNSGGGAAARIKCRII
jgi:acetamidase/formamidase